MRGQQPAGRRTDAGTLAGAVLFCGLLAAQVAVPVQRLASDAPPRFGWQMFSTLRLHPVFSVRYASGVLDTVRVQEHVVRARPEIDLTAVLPPHLCRTVEGADAVRLEWPAGGERPPRIDEYPCP